MAREGQDEHARRKKCNDEEWRASEITKNNRAARERLTEHESELTRSFKRIDTTTKGEWRTMKKRETE
jgi:hypothetical protein